MLNDLLGIRLRFSTISAVRPAAAVCLLVMAVSCVGNIVEYPVQEELDKRRLTAVLKGDDFRAKNAVRGQLSKLKPTDRLALLKELLGEKDPPTRLLAIVELLKLSQETWEPLLDEVAAYDPDETVRAFAAAALAKGEKGKPEGDGLETDK